MTLFWISYFVCACMVVGMFCFIIREELKEGKEFEVRLKDFLAGCILVLVPVLNLLVVVLMVTYLFDEYLKDRVIFTIKHKE